MKSEFKAVQCGAVKFGAFLVSVIAVCVFLSGSQSCAQGDDAYVNRVHNASYDELFRMAKEKERRIGVVGPRQSLADNGFNPFQTSASESTGSYSEKTGDGIYWIYGGMILIAFGGLWFLGQVLDQKHREELHAIHGKTEGEKFTRWRSRMMRFGIWLHNRNGSQTNWSGNDAGDRLDLVWGLRE